MTPAVFSRFMATSARYLLAETMPHQGQNAVIAPERRQGPDNAPPPGLKPRARGGYSPRRITDRI